MNRTYLPKVNMKSAILATLVLLPFLLSAQTGPKPVINCDAKDFTETLNYLSSDLMEGREAGTKGASLASDYIASIMKANGLQPYGDKVSDSTRSWFQNFEALSYKSERDSMTLLINRDNREAITNPPETQVVKLRNILGIIMGKDTSRSIIIGAHYDHLGIRNGQIYNGADDNASGVSGLLALTRVWSAGSEILPCNIIFASWTAEEKGEIGSQYFLQHYPAIKGKIILSINMDMISRSAPEDSTGRAISIGTLPESENFRELAREANRKLNKQFELDLWDVTGHYGSDYAYFARGGIPVMTFFAGYNEDYHTPKDTAQKVDLQKMSDILELVNECLLQVTEKIRANKLNTE